MRIFLLPVSTKRTLIYCERLQQPAPGSGAKQPLSERIIHRASATWAQWEKAEKGWQKQVTVYGNRLFSRVPYEECGLKSFPPATKKRLEEIDRGEHKFECLYPGEFMKGRNIMDVLKRLATERQALHRRRMWWSIGLMPVSAPFTLVPVIPNLPFFWLCFRAYSHYRALYGGKLLEHVLQKGLVRTTDSQLMDELYAAGLVHPTRSASREAVKLTEEEIAKVVSKTESEASNGHSEAMVLQRWNGKLIAEALKLPEMEIEIERAVEQVEKALAKEKNEGTAGHGSASKSENKS